MIINYLENKFSNYIIMNKKYKLVLARFKLSNKK